MMKLLLIPDVHENIERVDRILANHADATQVVFLGDYFDSFEYNDDLDHYYKTCEWLKSKIENPTYTFLIGNHDQAYWSPIPAYKATGYKESKQLIINEVLGADFWRKMKFFHYQEISNRKWVFSHAGLQTNHFDYNFELTASHFDLMHDKICSKFGMRLVDSRLTPGAGRGGRADWTAGLTWADFRSEFQIVEGLDQVVGHTMCWQPQCKKELGSLRYTRYTNVSESLTNVCLDTKLDFVGIIDDTGRLEVVRTANDVKKLFQSS